MDIKPIGGQAPDVVSANTTASTAHPVAAEVAKPVAKAVEAPVNAVQAAVPAPDPEKLKQAVHSINNAIQAFSRDVEFSIDKDTDEIVVKVVDKKTHDVIRQIPSEEMMAISKALDKLQGLIIRQKA